MSRRLDPGIHAALSDLRELNLEGKVRGVTRYTDRVTFWLGDPNARPPLAPVFPHAPPPPHGAQAPDADVRVLTDPEITAALRRLLVLAERGELTLFSASYYDGDEIVCALPTGVTTQPILVPPGARYECAASLPSDAVIDAETAGNMLTRIEVAHAKMLERAALDALRREAVECEHGVVGRIPPPDDLAARRAWRLGIGRDAHVYEPPEHRARRVEAWRLGDPLVC